jgi:L-arabinokinase
MFQIESSQYDQGTAGLPADVVDFIDRLNRLQELNADINGFFSPDSDLIVTRSPGRIDVMGGIADYSGSLVLQLPTYESTIVALQRDPSPAIKILSLGAGPRARVLRFEMPIRDLQEEGDPVRYDRARDYFASDPGNHWASYVAGAFLVLMRERNARFSEGARIFIASNLPQGKGVSSSAAIEVATMQAIACSFELKIAPTDLALLCQITENAVVGAPCGIMDQMTAVCGEPGKLLALLCQPAKLQGTIPIPNGLSVWGLDSGITHSVSGTEYSSVRIGAFMGYRIIAGQAGLSVDIETYPGRVAINDPKWAGYLANIDPSEFEKLYAAGLPTVMSGSEFIAKYHGTTDSVARVDPDRTYRVRTATAHPIYEHSRVKEFARLLKVTIDNSGMERLGELMYQSNESYSACGLGSDGTDLLVDLIKNAGPQSGLYGARVTGGGSGGTVAVLGRHSAEDAVRRVARRYGEITGRQPYLFRGSSPGASQFGCVRMRAIAKTS